MVSDPLGELRRELAERLAQKFDVPLDLVLGEPGMSYADIEAVMPTPTQAAHALHAIVRGMQRPVNEPGPDPLA